MTETTYAGYSADALRELAEAATPGPWYPRWGGEPGFIYSSPASKLIGEVYAGKTDAHRDLDLDFIAALHPLTVRALLDAIARLEADNARLRGAAQTFCEERSDVALDRLIAAIEEEAAGE